MDDNKIRKSRISIFNALVNDPKMVRVINDAINAPVGSTKKVKAKSILSIVKKVNKGRGDGKGGALDYFNQFNQVQNSPMLPTPKAAPASSAGAFNETFAPVFKDAWSTIKWAGQGVKNWAMTPPSSTVILPKTPDFKTKMAELGASNPMGSLSEIANTFKSNLEAKKPDPITNAEQAANYFAGKPINALTTEPIKSTQPGAKTDTTSGLLGQIQSKYTPATKVDVSSNISDPNKINQSSQNNQKKTETITTNPDGTTQKKTVVTEDQPTSTSSSSGFSQGSKISVKTDGTSNLATPGVGLTDLTSKAVKGNAKYYNDNNLGEAAFVTDTLSSLGEETPEEHKNALIPVLKETYNLSAKLAEAEKYANIDPTKAKMSEIDYIKNRDKVISKINGLSEAATIKGASMDLTNPANAAIMDNYKKYLDILKGKQNQQYGEYLNRDIKRLQDETARTEKSYNDAVALYNSDLKEQDGSYTADYNNKKAILEDLYKAIGDAPSKFYSLQNQIHTYNKNQVESLTDNIKPYDKDYPTFEEALWDTSTDNKGGVLPDVNLTSVLNDKAAQGYNPMAGLDRYTKAARTSLDYFNSNSDYTSTLTEGQNYLNNFKEYADFLYDNEPEAYKVLAPAIVKAGEAVISKQGEGVREYVLGNYKPVFNMIKGLDKSIGSVNYTTFSKANSGVDPKIVKKVYDGYAGYVDMLSGSTDENLYSGNSLGKPTIQQEAESYVTNNPGVTLNEAMAIQVQNLITAQDQLDFQNKI